MINLIGVIVALTVNGLANALPLNGKLTGQISDSFAVYFVPAGYVFAIWGIIYIGLLAFGIYQALPSQRTNPRLRSLGYWFALSCLANSVWIFFWQLSTLPTDAHCHAHPAHLPDRDLSAGQPQRVGCDCAGRRLHRAGPAGASPGKRTTCGVNDQSHGACDLRVAPASGQMRQSQPDTRFLRETGCLEL